MTKGYWIIERSSCEECQGEKVIQNPHWAAFWEKYPLGHWPEIEEERQFWAECGYYNGPPPEEHICDCCQGKGFTEKDVPLLHALIAFGLVPASSGVA